jgi:hypothetical protein
MTTTTHEWNTGRSYTANGQRIIATKAAKGILFYDISRGIAGMVPHNAFLPLNDTASVRQHVMRCYDNNNYRPCAEASAFADSIARNA